MTHPLLAITSEAGGDALRASKSSLSHIRAVKQLSQVLDCPANWENVVEAIKARIVKSPKPWEDLRNASFSEDWIKRCLHGIETILIDDGLDGEDEVFDYTWHDQFTGSKCKRILRIEKVAEKIIDDVCVRLMSGEISVDKSDIEQTAFRMIVQKFDEAIRQALWDDEIVGFKSVICYRTGLNIGPNPLEDDVQKELMAHLNDSDSPNNWCAFQRLDSLLLNSWIVHRTATLIHETEGQHMKPFQFHTGLGDNDITLSLSSPSHLQAFIRQYPKVPIVLLHASYPFTKEAGYLASVYENVYADIGEVFPQISKEGQEKVLREILEVCPTEKILWSTDGHWFPETYLLAVIQVREALEVVSKPATWMINTRDILLNVIGTLGLCSTESVKRRTSGESNRKYTLQHLQHSLLIKFRTEILTNSASGPPRSHVSNIRFEPAQDLLKSTSYDEIPPAAVSGLHI